MLLYKGKKDSRVDHIYMVYGMRDKEVIKSWKLGVSPPQKYSRYSVGDPVHLPAQYAFYLEAWKVKRTRRRKELVFSSHAALSL